ncbi:MAG: phage major capsid protein [Clostridia bacterium]|nr:phage major capsid protein [Clostridia bacterium]
MADALEMGTMFPQDLTEDLFNTVRGKSAIAELCPQSPISFTGNDVFVFSMDDEVALVGEGEKKEQGAVAVEPVKIVPVKIEYGKRVSDEFMYASDEKRLDILAAFNEGFAAKVARGLDIMAMHGVNPRTGTKSQLITNSFADVTNVVTYDASAPDDNLMEAIAGLGDYDCTGMALSKDFAGAMGKIKTNNTLVYPEFAFGAQATAFYGTPCAVNTTVSFDGQTEAIVGDYSAFRWGFAKEIPLEVIPYGDPDGSGDDLKAYNQVYLRAEAYIGWGVLDDNAFYKIAGSVNPGSVKTTSAKASK